MDVSWTSWPGHSSVTSWMAPCWRRSAASKDQAGRWSSRAKVPGASTRSLKRELNCSGRSHAFGFAQEASEGRLGPARLCCNSLRRVEPCPGALLGVDERGSASGPIGGWCETTDGRPGWSRRSLPRGADERQNGRKTSQRESRGGVACSPAVRGVSKSCQEQVVRLVELTADAAGERLEERRGGLLRLGRLVERLHTYTENQLVEQPAIGLFAALGWQTVPARGGLPAG